MRHFNQFRIERYDPMNEQLLKTLSYTPTAVATDTVSRCIRDDGTEYVFPLVRGNPMHLAGPLRGWQDIDIHHLPVDCVPWPNRPPGKCWFIGKGWDADFRPVDVVVQYAPVYQSAWGKRKPDTWKPVRLEVLEAAEHPTGNSSSKSQGMRENAT